MEPFSISLNSQNNRLNLEVPFSRYESVAQRLNSIRLTWFYLNGTRSFLGRVDEPINNSRVISLLESSEDIPPGFVNRYFNNNDSSFEDPLDEFDSLSTQSDDSQDPSEI